MGCLESRQRGRLAPPNRVTFAVTSHGLMGPRGRGPQGVRDVDQTVGRDTLEIAVDHGGDDPAFDAGHLRGSDMGQPPFLDGVANGNDQISAHRHLGGLRCW